MKILILSVTAGQGHNATAKALAAMLEARSHEVEVADTFRKTSRMLYTFVDKGYLLAASRFKKLYGQGYYRLEKRKSNSYTSSFARLAYRAIAKKLNKFIKEKDPDVIVCAHVFSAMLLDIIKQRYGLRAKTVGIVTDFAMHPYWEETLRLDKLVLANDFLIPAALRKGFRREQLLTTGIPIHPKFSQGVGKREAKAALGFDPEKPLLLLMSGSMGYGNMVKLLKELDSSRHDFSIASVSGNNKKTFEAIEKESWKKPLQNIGYTDKVDLLMDAADCIVTKPGGLTASEALAKRLPLIIANPIPGQEVHNSEFLQNCGTAMGSSATHPLPDAVHLFFAHPRVRESMMENIELIRRPNASSDLCDAVEKLCTETKN